MVFPTKRTTVGRLHRRLLMWGMMPVMIPFTISVTLIWLSVLVLGGLLAALDRYHFDKPATVTLDVRADCGVLPKLEVRQVGADPVQTEIEFTLDAGENATCETSTIRVRTGTAEPLPIDTAFDIDWYRAAPEDFQRADLLSDHSFELTFKPYPELAQAGSVTGSAVHGYLLFPNLLEPVRRIPLLPFDLYPVYALHLDLSGSAEPQADAEASFITLEQLDRSRSRAKMEVSISPGFDLIMHRLFWGSETRRSIVGQDQRGENATILSVPASGATLRMELLHTNWENRNQAILIAASSTLGLGLAFLAEAIMLMIIDGLRSLRRRARRIQRALEEAQAAEEASTDQHS